MKQRWPRCLKNVHEKTVVSLRYTRTQEISKSPRRLSIACWKVAGALHSPCGIRAGSKRPLLEISAHFYQYKD